MCSFISSRMELSSTICAFVTSEAWAKTSITVNADWSVSRTTASGFAIDSADSTVRSIEYFAPSISTVSRDEPAGVSKGVKNTRLSPDLANFMVCPSKTPST